MINDRVRQLADGLTIDIGLLALAIVAKAYHMSVDPSSMSHELGLGSQRASSSDIVLAANKCGLKAKLLEKQEIDRLKAVPRPAILRMKDGAYFVLENSKSGQDMLRDPLDIRGRITNLAELVPEWSGEIILVAKRPPLAEERSEEFGFSWFVTAALRYKSTLIHIMICSFFIQCFALVTPLFFQVVVDKVLVHDSVATLDVIVVALLFIGVFDVMLQYLRSYGLYHTASRIDVDLGSQLFDRLLKLPVSYFESRPTGQTIARIRELETIRTFLTGQALTSIIDVLFAVIFLSILFYYSAMLTFVVLSTVPIFIIIASVIRPILRKKIKEKFNRGALSQQYLVESVVGALTLKAAAVEPLVQKQWEDRLASYVKTSFDALMIGSLGQNCVQYISKLLTALILLFGAKAVISGDMTAGQLIAFNMLAGQLVAPILRLSQLWQDLQQVQISVARIGDIFSHPAEDQVGIAGSPRSRISGSIEFEKVTFRYRADRNPVLAEVSFSIPAGQVIGIVGQSGSGKSTLTKLIQRLYVPEKGRVLIDGVDIAKTPPHWFRKQIGVVLQENILFNRSISENIALAKPGMSRGEIIAIAKLAGAHEFIQRLPQGYDTHIQERGSNLSGGQRQRIAIARALATKPRILIFDEATSALDYESERIIQSNMREIVRGRTVIIVAHRLAAVRHCDRILSMSEGSIVEDGCHSELIVRPNGIYGQLWSIQCDNGVLAGAHGGK